MFELIFFIPVLIVAGVWGFFLLNFASNSRRFLSDDILCANDKQRKEAEDTMKAIHLMAPVWFMVVAIAVIFLVNEFHPFIRLNIVGVALVAGGFLFAYLGWAVGILIRSDMNASADKDSKFYSRVFMISFMGSGLVVMAIGFIAMAGV